jgi:hypothetical protein
LRRRRRNADYAPDATIGQARVLGAPISQFWALGFAVCSVLAQVSAAAAVDSRLLP